MAVVVIPGGRRNASQSQVQAAMSSQLSPSFVASQQARAGGGAASPTVTNTYNPNRGRTGNVGVRSGFGTGLSSGLSSTPFTSGKWNSQINQQKGRELGYTGEYGAGGFDTFLSENPDKYYDYIKWRGGVDPEYAPHLDFDKQMEGQQQFGRPLNQYIASDIGYTKENFPNYYGIGRGELGSGINNVDILGYAENAEAKTRYEDMRKVFEPGYKWEQKNLTPEGFDETAYSELNPDVFESVYSGQYISPTQQYLLEGQNQNRPYSYEQAGASNMQQEPAWATELRNLFASGTQIANNASTAQSDLPIPVRPQEMAAPDYLSNDMQGMDDRQKRAYLATEALYGGGYGQDAENYYLNLLQRSVQDDSNNVTNFDLLPIETQFLQYMGLPISNGSEFLKALARRLAGRVRSNA